MRLHDYLRPAQVLIDLAADDVHTAVEALADHLAAVGAVPDRAAATGALAAREAAHTTALGEGVALPHATLPGLERPVLAVALARSPVPFGPAGTDPVGLFFVLLSPPGHDAEHIRLLARICRIARHPGFVADVLAAADGESAVDRIRRIDEMHV